MNTTIENPTTVRELTRYVEREHPRLRTSYKDHHEQVVVVGQPGAKPPIGLWEILGNSEFEMQAHTTDSRGRWIGVVNQGEGP